MNSSQRRKARRQIERLRKQAEIVGALAMIPARVPTGAENQESPRDWKRAGRWAVVGAVLSTALTVGVSGADFRLIPILGMIALLIVLPEVVREPPRRRKVILGTVVTCSVVVLLIGAPPPTQPQQRGGKDSGVIHGASLIQIGQGGVFFDLGDDRMQLIADSEMVVEKIDGKLSISSVIRDGTGKVIGRIRNNEWEVFPPAWDRNYNDNALEIKNSFGEVVFQARIVGDVLQLQGEWYTRDGSGVRLVQAHDRPGVGAMVEMSDARGRFSRNPKIKIRELFKYPSRDFFGELIS